MYMAWHLCPCRTQRIERNLRAIRPFQQRKHLLWQMGIPIKQAMSGEANETFNRENNTASATRAPAPNKSRKINERTSLPYTDCAIAIDNFDRYT